MRGPAFLGPQSTHSDPERDIIQSGRRRRRTETEQNRKSFNEHTIVRSLGEKEGGYVPKVTPSFFPSPPPSPRLSSAGRARENACLNRCMVKCLLPASLSLMGPLGNATGKLETVFIESTTTPTNEQAAVSTRIAPTRTEARRERREGGAAFIERVNLLGML